LRTGLQKNVTLDHDTKGVLGIPAIADTILAKIENCDVFVADVSFTGKGTRNTKNLPNSNVMIELGYAMGKLGGGSIILIMNTEFGSWKKLPFDLLHRRKPITFSTAGNINEEKKKLIDLLEEILREYSEKHVSRFLEVGLQAVGPYTGMYRFDVYLTNKSNKPIGGYYVDLELPNIGATSGQNEYYEQDKIGKKFIFQPHNHPSIVPGGTDFSFRNTKRIQIGPGATDKIGAIGCDLSKATNQSIKLTVSADDVAANFQEFVLSSLIEKSIKP
jgi:hypothetical protein